MRKILNIMILFFVSITIVNGQIPEKFNYQAVIRDNSGELLKNQDVSFRISILSGSATSDPVYQEKHNVQSNDLGLCNLKIGDGTDQTTNFDEIEWSSGNYFMKVELDENAGTDYTDMGAVQLLSVPFALYAKDVANKDDADANPTNEIQDLNLTGDILTITNHPSPTTINLTPYQGNNTDEQELTLEGDTLKISNGNEVILPYDSSKWVMNGNTMYYNGGNVGIGSSSPVSNLEVKGTAVTSDALFQVINSNNDTVFAVYPDGVKIFVDSEAKGKVGGFAISGRSPSKANEEYYLRVTPDSTQIIINQSADKGKVGGFAISGRSPSKAIEEDYLLVTADSTRIYINDTTQIKGKVGGFAISGRSPSKNGSNPFVNLTPNNYFIGHQSGASNTTGKYNSFYGYQTGMNNSTGSQNVFIGYQTGKLNNWGMNNTFIGNKAGYNNQFGGQNIFLGNNAGYSSIGGDQNIFLGNNAGYSNIGGGANIFIGDSTGFLNRHGVYNIYMGPGSARNNQGRDNIFLGEGTGYKSDSVNQCIFIGWQSGSFAQGDSNIYIGTQTGGGNPLNENRGIRNISIGNGAGGNINSGSYNVFIGQESGGSSSDGFENVYIGLRAGSHPNNISGAKNVFIGSYAGANETGSNKLYISNSDTDKPLIGGDFSTGQVKVSHILNINGIEDYPASPEIGDIIRLENSSDPPGLYVYNGTAWQAIATW